MKGKLITKDLQIVGKYLDLYEVLLKLEIKHGRSLPYKAIEREALKRFKKIKQPLSKRTLKRMLDTMRASGVLFYPRGGFIERITYFEK